MKKALNIVLITIICALPLAAQSINQPLNHCPQPVVPQVEFGSTSAALNHWQTTLPMAAQSGISTTNGEQHKIGGPRRVGENDHPKDIAQTPIGNVPLVAFALLLTIYCLRKNRKSLGDGR